MARVSKKIVLQLARLWLPSKLLPCPLEDDKRLMPLPPSSGLQETSEKY